MKKLVLLAALGLSACMGEMRNADLKPTVAVNRTAEGIGPVALTIVDERPSTTISDVKTGGANIRLGEALPLVEPSVKNSLIANGFTPADRSAAAERKLRVEIRSIELKIAGGFASASLLPNAALKAVATNRGQVFERFYRAENPTSTSIGTTDEQRDLLVGDVLSKALSALANDPELMGFLAR